VLEDARENLTVLERVSSYHRAALAAEREILRLMGAGPTGVSPERADSLLGDLTWWQGSDHWFTGALESLIDGGRLSIVQSEGLRQVLASWLRNVESVRFAEDQENAFFIDHFMPFLQREAYVPQIAELAQVSPGTGYEPGYGRVNWLAEPRDHSPIITSQEFQNLVLQRLWIQVDILKAYEEFEGQLNDLIEMIEADVGSR
jgi:hypothetical protein